MKYNNKYSDVSSAINLIIDFKARFEEELKECENINTAKHTRDLLISKFNKDCSSKIIKNHLLNESEILINRRF
jgi:hypothetical protein